MKLGDVETFFEDGAWRNRVEGSGTTALSFATQDSAVDVGRREAERLQSTHTVRNTHGEVTQMSDPLTPHGADDDPELADDELSLNEAATDETSAHTPTNEKPSTSDLEDRI
jgi:hypothetical protein